MNKNDHYALAALATSFAFGGYIGLAAFLTWAIIVIFVIKGE